MLLKVELEHELSRSGINDLVVGSPLLKNWTLRPIKIGFTAYNSIIQSGGEARIFHALRDSVYLRIDEEIIWIGAGLRFAHPRAVILDGPVVPHSTGNLYKLDVSPEQVWRPSVHSLRPTGARRFVENTSRLRIAVSAIGCPRGIGRLLLGQQPEFPLNLAVPKIKDLELAYRNLDLNRILDTSISLLGLGPGLTPSGDDFVGASVWGRYILMKHSGIDCKWLSILNRLRREVKERSNAISAALFGDLTHGVTFLSLHQLAGALIDDDPIADIVLKAREVVKLGHSSGWDMLAGFIVGVTGRLNSD